MSLARISDVTHSIDHIYTTQQLYQSVQSDLGYDAEAVIELRRSFAEFITNPEESYEFGKCVGPDPGKYLWHVHMVPINMPEKVRQWNIDYANYSRCTSDRYLMFAEHTNGLHSSFLLIDHLIDPGAHNLWTPPYRRALSSMESISEQFYFSKKIAA